jgi:putative addiction module CopG family antidote
MATTSLNISLPEALKEFVHQRVAEKAYSNPSDYVRALIREDQRRRAEEKSRTAPFRRAGVGSAAARHPRRLARHPP